MCKKSLFDSSKGKSPKAPMRTNILGSRKEWDPYM